MKTLLPAKRNGRIAEQFVRPTVFYSFIDGRYIHIIHEKDENLVGLRYFQFLLPDINQSLRNTISLYLRDNPYRRTICPFKIIQISLLRMFFNIFVPSITKFIS